MSRVRSRFWRHHFAAGRRFPGAARSWGTKQGALGATDPRVPPEFGRGPKPGPEAAAGRAEPPPPGPAPPRSHGTRGGQRRTPNGRPDGSRNKRLSSSCRLPRCLHRSVSLHSAPHVAHHRLPRPSGFGARRRCRGGPVGVASRRQRTSRMASAAQRAMLRGDLGRAVLRAAGARSITGEEEAGGRCDGF